MYFFSLNLKSNAQNPNSKFQDSKSKLLQNPLPKSNSPLKPLFHPQKIKQSFWISHHVPKNALDRLQQNVPTRSHDFVNALWQHNKTNDSRPLVFEGIKIPNPRSHDFANALWHQRNIDNDKTGRSHSISSGGRQIEPWSHDSQGSISRPKIKKFQIPKSKNAISHSEQKYQNANHQRKHDFQGVHYNFQGPWQIVVGCCGYSFMYGWFPMSKLRKNWKYMIFL